MGAALTGAANGDAGPGRHINRGGPRMAGWLVGVELELPLFRLNEELL